jgi:hypothetical protein
MPAGPPPAIQHVVRFCCVIAAISCRLDRCNPETWPNGEIGIPPSGENQLSRPNAPGVAMDAVRRIKKAAHGGAAANRRHMERRRGGDKNDFAPYANKETSCLGICSRQR